MVKPFCLYHYSHLIFFDKILSIKEVQLKKKKKSKPWELFELDFLFYILETIIRDKERRKTKSTRKILYICMVQQHF